MKNTGKMNKGIFTILLGLSVSAFTSQALAQGGTWETKTPMPAARARALAVLAYQGITQPQAETPVLSAAVIPAATATGPFAYVTHAGAKTVSVIDTRTNTVVATINLGTNGPGDIAITPDGAFAYTATTALNMSVIETATNTVVATIGLAGNIPGCVAITPDGAFA